MIVMLHVVVTYSWYSKVYTVGDDDSMDGRTARKVARVGACGFPVRLFYK
jgi:hypothetical protein